MAPSDSHYLDHAAGTPPLPEVVELVCRLFEEGPGNPSGIHRRARSAAAIVEEAREAVAATVGAHPSEVIFTSGGTEADNLAVKGIAAAQRERGLDRVVVSAVEHHAVLDSALWLRTLGFEVDLAPVGPEGTVDLDRLSELLEDDAAGRTGLVSVMTANNETGAIQPVREVAELVRDLAPDAVVHSDACQAFSSQDVSFDALGVDAITLSSHKIGGPQGAGALVVREETPLQRVAHGGAQELGRRAGTHDVVAIAGFGLAASISAAKRHEFAERTGALRDLLEQRVLEEVPEAVVTAAQAERLPHISNVRIPGSAAEELLILLDREGVCASSGSACASGSLEPSHVLSAMGLGPSEARSALRFSFGRTSELADVEAAVAALARAVRRQIAARGSWPRLATG